MSTPIKFDDIDKVLGEADALVLKINSMVTEDVSDAHQMEFEKRLKELESIKSEMQAKMSQENQSQQSGTYAEGFHEAYQEIVRAMKNLKELLN